jgi:hypothetical protein
MTLYAPQLSSLKLRDFQYTSDTDSKYRFFSQELDQREVLIFFLSSSQYLLITAQKTTQGYWTATSGEFAIYGDGNSVEDAINNYLDLLRDYYLDLDKEENILGPFLQKELSNLRKFLI